MYVIELHVLASTNLLRILPYYACPTYETSWIELIGYLIVFLFCFQNFVDALSVVTKLHVYCGMTTALQPVIQAPEHQAVS